MKQIVILLFSLLAFNVTAAPVNINKANAKTIAKSLQGIGQKKAEAIVRYRKKHGPFETVKDLMKVKGIGKKTVMKNRADILLDASKKAKKPKKQKK